MTRDEGLGTDKFACLREVHLQPSHSWRFWPPQLSLPVLVCRACLACDHGERAAMRVYAAHDDRDN